MKHYFIINPVAGKGNLADQLVKEIKTAFSNQVEEYEIYITKGIGDARNQVQKVCQNYRQDITFYACGGDGTMNEVANGLLGYPHAYLGVIKIGSCNDFLKNFPDYDFRSVDKAIKGSVKYLDVLKVNNLYTMNVANIGFDAKANADASNYKKRIKKIKTAYNLAIARNLLSKMSRSVIVEADDKIIYNGKMLLMTFANGGFYGGGYNCAPLAICDDGFQEITIIKAVSRITLVSLLKTYKKGQHLNNPKLATIITYQKAKKARITSSNLINVCLDGENFLWKEIDIQVCEKLVKMVFPSQNIN